MENRSRPRFHTRETLVGSRRAGDEPHPIHRQPDGDGRREAGSSTQNEGETQEQASNVT